MQAQNLNNIEPGFETFLSVIVLQDKRSEGEQDGNWLRSRVVGMFLKVADHTRRHQAITQTGVYLSLKVFCGIHLRAISQVFMNFIQDHELKSVICVRDYTLKLLPHLPGANEYEIIHRHSMIVDQMY